MALVSRQAQLDSGTATGGGSMKARQVSAAILALILSYAMCGVSAAAPLKPADVPEPLKPWIDWVVDDDKERLCPFLYNSFATKRCIWPGALRLDLRATTGSFSGSWRVFSDSWIVLPGNQVHWPLDVEVNGIARAVIARNGKPSLHLMPGMYSITGNFSWSALPETLTIAADTGIIKLSVRGEEMKFPRINNNGEIWLGRSEGNLSDEQNGIKNSHTVTVQRRIVDEIPFLVYTRIEVDVIGEQRELVLGQPLLDGFIPIAVISPLPARIEANGELRVQLRAGRHVIEVRARHPQELDGLQLPAQASPWPTSEVWAFDARNDLRLVEIVGGQAVDPSQTQAPKDWHHLPVYTVAAGDGFNFTVIRRGDPEPEPNKFTLERQLWLDFDGRGYTTQDRIDGTITRDWRLDSGPDLQLGQVVVDGQPRFITRRENDGPHGVELRRHRINLVADARMERGHDQFAATGWAHDFHNVKATLNLPPGWDVFAINGVDNVPDTWLARWTLLDLFLVLVISASVLRLWDRRAAVCTLLMLSVIWHAPDAPHYIWLSLFVAIALLRVLPQGRARSMVIGFRNLTVLGLAIICVPFAVHEFRLAVYPQLEFAHLHVATPMHQRVAGARVEAERARDQAMPMAAMEADMMVMDDRSEVAQAAGAMLKSAPQRYASETVRAEPAKIFALDPAAIIQTGPGLPEWRWKSMHLSWNGPVDQNQRVAITYIPPLLNVVIHVLRVLLIGVVLILIFGIGSRRVFANSAPTALLLMLGLIAFGAPTADAVAGDIPDPALLETLRQRLNAPPECANQCADITRMRLQLDAARLQFRLETHSDHPSAIPLPGQAQQWSPTLVLVDGNPTAELARDPRGFLWLQLPLGVHQVALSGALPARRNVQIALPLRPHTVESMVEGWEVRGLREDGQVEGQLQLTRLATDASPVDTTAFETNQLPPFIRIDRTLRLGLDWTLVTKVVRVAGGNTAAVFEVPLVAGESVVTPGIEVANGMVRVNLGARARSLTWQSNLEHSQVIALTAPDTTAWLETWTLQAAPMWHIGFAGIAPVHHRGGGDEWLPQWRPWPGESVSFNVGKPGGVPGQSLTIDSSSVSLKPGTRATDATLSLRVRSSKGGQYTLRLPDEVTLQGVRINNVSEPLRAEGRNLTIPVTPGAQTVDIEWRKASGISTRFSSDAIDLTIPSINHQIEMNLGRDRWTLFTYGPSLGPAVRFWSLFAILLVVAVGLARIPLTPLNTGQWLLLAIGLSQVAVPLAAVVVLWLLALGLRERYGAGLIGYRFNLTQIGLVVLSLAAMAILIEAIRHGLLGHPDMHVAGNGSNAHQLRWYADRVLAEPPSATVLSVPILVYRLLMLGWALWLAFAILRWLRWGWSCFSTDGLWRAWRKPKAAPA